MFLTTGPCPPSFNVDGIDHPLIDAVANVEKEMNVTTPYPRMELWMMVIAAVAVLTFLRNS